jgi:hypothetical protein
MRAGLSGFVSQQGQHRHVLTASGAHPTSSPVSAEGKAFKSVRVVPLSAEFRTCGAIQLCHTRPKSSTVCVKMITKLKKMPVPNKGLYNHRWMNEYNFTDRRLDAIATCTHALYGGTCLNNLMRFNVVIRTLSACYWWTRLHKWVLLVIHLNRSC